jgi:3-phenylpropionate/trans-cinnamate dioxygenase ferredoxin subunit
MTWHDVASISEVQPDEVTPVRVGKQQIALYNLNGSIHATSNICSHQYALMSDGYVEDDWVECPLHQARFDIVTGKALCDPATEDLQVFPVKIEGDRIFVEVD